MSDTTTIPTRRGKAAYVAANQVIRVINTHGEQVVDTWAFNRHDISEFMSMEHTRSWLRRLIPHVGDSLVTNHRRPILTVLEDTSGGIHDTLLAACDQYRYEQLGCTEYHDNCTDNLARGLAEFGVKPPDTPSPLNLFMNIPWVSDGSLSLETPISTPNCYIRLRDDMDLIIAVSPPAQWTCCRSTVSRESRLRRIFGSRRSGRSVQAVAAGSRLPAPSRRTSGVCGSTQARRTRLAAEARRRGVRLPHRSGHRGDRARNGRPLDLIAGERNMCEVG